MGTIKDFEDLEIWRLSRELVNLIYSDFRLCRDFTFRNQVTGAGISIMNNISEGFFRNSDTEFRHFLNIAKGSSGEVKSMYYIAEDQNYVSAELALEKEQMSENNGWGHHSHEISQNNPKALTFRRNIQ